VIFPLDDTHAFSDDLDLEIISTLSDY